MCGIVGYIGDREVVPLILNGLRKLEYRGYDSAGIVAVCNGRLDAVRAEGKLERLVAKLEGHPLVGSFGLGHTRWATHGPPTERNAHPVVDSRERVAVIHNGIIENFLELKRDLQEQGWSFGTDTDTEVVASLISARLEEELEQEAGDDALLRAVTRVVQQLEGMYAFAALTAAGGRREVVAARHGPPPVLGLGEGEQFLALDPAAPLEHTQDVIFLENGDLARLTRDGVEVLDRTGHPVERKLHRLNWNPIQTEKGGYKHFMLKEIHEQPQAVQDTFAGRIDFEAGRGVLDEPGLQEDELRRDGRTPPPAVGA